MQQFGGGSLGTRRSAREEVAAKMDDSKQSADRAELKSNDDAAAEHDSADRMLAKLKATLSGLKEASARGKPSRARR